MKKLYTIFTILSVVVGFAQIPNGYYNTANGLNGYALKTELRNIISNNTNASGSSSNYAGLWDLFTVSGFRDNYYENNGSLLDVYSERPSGADSYEYNSTTQQCGGSTPSAEGGCYNREHTLPQNVFGQNNYPMYSDAHFVLPTDNRVNGWRDNYPFGVVTTSITAVTASNGTVPNADNIPCTTSNGSKLGQNINSGYSAGYSGVVFEPINEFKGDIARALLYFATRYENEIPSWSYTMFNGTSNQVFTNAFLNILIKWHNLDPVSPYEIAKNNAVYTFQNNRNPYIDHPEYVCEIWPTQCTALGTNSFEATANISIYPNPTNNNRININSEVELSEIELININGQIVQKINKPNNISNVYTLENLPQGFYFVKLTSFDNQTATKKILVN